MPITAENARRFLSVLRRAVRDEHDYDEYERLWTEARTCPDLPHWLDALSTGRDLWLFFRNYQGTVTGKYRVRDLLIDETIVPWVQHIESGQCQLPPSTTQVRIPPTQRTVNILVSSPGDLRPERLAVARIAKEIAAEERLTVQVILWEGGGATHPDIPSLAPYVDQGDVIENITNQLHARGGLDVYVGMIWIRMGTPTGGFRSGTEAELETARRLKRTTNRPAAILFYHKTGAIPYHADTSQMADVANFVGELKASKALVVEFDSEPDLSSKLKANLREAIALALRTEEPKPLACPDCGSIELTFGEEMDVDWDRGDDGEPVPSPYTYPVIHCMKCDWVFRA